MRTEAHKRAEKKYKSNVKRFTVDFTPKEQDIYEHLSKQPKKQTYIKDLIRADMERQEKGIYLISRDSMDDACIIEGYIDGTEAEADEYCEKINANAEYEWECFTYEKLEKLSK